MENLTYVEFLKEALAGKNEYLSRETAEKIAKKDLQKRNPLMSRLKDAKRKLAACLEEHEIPEKFRQMSYDELHHALYEGSKKIDRKCRSQMNYAFLEKLIPLIEEKAKRTGEWVNDGNTKKILNQMLTEYIKE